MLKAKAALVLAACTLALSVLAVPGSASSGAPDSAVVTKSYVDEVFLPGLADYGIGLYRDAFRLNPTQFEKTLSSVQQLASRSGEDALRQAVLDEVLSRLVRGSDGKAVSLAPGETLLGGQGCMASVLSGNLCTAGQTVDFTAGAELASGAAPAAGHRLCFLQEGGLRALSAASVQVSGYYRILPAPRPKYGDIADALYAMGLFAGTNNGYELGRPATRIEILVMLIKLLGENDAATSYKGAHPFKDVPAWANAYVAYSYNKGYTAGTSASAFSPNSLATADQYATFVLKALGYDSNKDFTWSKALAYTQTLGMISPAESKLLGGVFLRDKMVYLSYYALFSDYKGKSASLLDGLVSAGKITKAAADGATGSVTRTRP